MTNKTIKYGVIATLTLGLSYIPVNTLLDEFNSIGQMNIPYFVEVGRIHNKIQKKENLETKVNVLESQNIYKNCFNVEGFKNLAYALE